jgi:hypothetical protein
VVSPSRGRAARTVGDFGDESLRQQLVLIDAMAGRGLSIPFCLRLLPYHVLRVAIILVANELHHF